MKQVWRRRTLRFPLIGKSFIPQANKICPDLTGNFQKSASSLQGDLIPKKLESETDRGASGEQKDQTWGS